MLDGQYEKQRHTGFPKVPIIFDLHRNQAEDDSESA